MDKGIINSIREAKKNYPDARFIVFGSEARDMSTAQSDVDICVLFPKLSKDSFELASEILSFLRNHTDRALDLVVLEEHAFSERSKQRWTLEYVIHREGRAV